MSDLDVSFIIIFTPLLVGTVAFLIMLAKIDKPSDD